MNTNEENEHKKSHPFLAKLFTGAACGVAFGLAAALVFAGIIKASGMDEMVKALKPETKEEELLEPGGKEDVEDIEEAKEEPKEEKKKEVKEEAKGGEDIASDRKAELTYTQETGIKDIVNDVMPCVVSITNRGVEEVRSMFGTRQYESTSVGSGIIIGENDSELLIATNNHVVAGANELSVCFGDDKDKVVSAKTKGNDPGNDLAIVAIDISDLSSDIRDSYKVAKIGKSSDLSVGDQVIAIGNALGYGQSVTTGIVSALDREVTIEGVTAKLIQTDAAINPGNSGGALLNMKGELIGINSSKFASTQVEGMGYAIPIDTAEPILTTLMNRETRDTVSDSERGYLGIGCQNVTDEIANTYDMPKGVYIMEIHEDSGAEKAGLKKGDIITAIEGVSVTDFDDLKGQLSYFKPGEVIEVTVQCVDSDGEYKEKTVLVELVGAAKADNNAGDSRQEHGDQQIPDTDNRSDGNDAYDQYDMEQFFDDLFRYGF